MKVNINDYFEKNPTKEVSLIKELKDSYNSITLKKNQRDTLYKLIDWSVEFKQIPDQKPSKKISELPAEEQILPLLQKWLKNYIKYLQTPINARPAKKLADKDIVEDPALAHILSSHYTFVKKETLGQVDIQKALQMHQILMTIENIQGHFLEAYIASILCKKPYNFIWCEGQTIIAADFCKRIFVNKIPELMLIQIKNKYNTENSSSSKIRENTPIAKWHRLGKKKNGNKKSTPSYKWSKLNTIIEDITGSNPNFNEKAYLAYLEKVIKKNPKVLFNE